MDIDRSLAIGGGRKDFLFAGRDCGISVNESCHDATKRLNTERKGSNVQEKNIFYAGITGQHGTLNGCTQCDDLIRI